MSMTVAELVREVCRRGVSLWAEPPDIFIAPAKKVPPELKAELRARKAEVIEYIKTIPSFSAGKLADLAAKRDKCESAGVSIAILDDGTMRICRTDADIHRAVQDGGAIYSPEDCYYRAQLTPQEQQLLHNFKKTFPGGCTSWEKAG